MHGCETGKVVSAEPWVPENFEAVAESDHHHL